MRWLIPVVLCSIAPFAQASEIIGLPSTVASIGAIDLDKPGALKALQRDNPKHYEAVMKKVDEAQTVKPVLDAQFKLGFFLDRPVADTYGTFVQPSYPARTRITVMADAAVYSITVRYTKGPAHSVPAR